MAAMIGADAFTGVTPRSTSSMRSHSSVCRMSSNDNNQTKVSGKNAIAAAMAVLVLGGSPALSNLPLLSVPAAEAATTAATKEAVSELKSMLGETKYEGTAAGKESAKAPTAVAPPPVAAPKPVAPKAVAPVAPKPVAPKPAAPKPILKPAAPAKKDPAKDAAAAKAKEAAKAAQAEATRKAEEEAKKVAEAKAQELKKLKVGALLHTAQMPVFRTHRPMSILPT